MLNNIPKNEWQYIIPSLICTAIFTATDFFGLIDKRLFSYWSGALIIEPYRIFTYHFIHADINHLGANIFGIVIARYFLQTLVLKHNYFFLLLISLLIPFQTFIFWFVDVFLYDNKMSLAVGFSGVLYGVNAFIILTSIYGKNRFLGLFCGLKKNNTTTKSMLFFTGVGMIFSLIPGVSLVGHLSGFIAGSLLFLI
mgnify:CR=1 FL=1